MGKERSRKKSSFGIVFWIAVILLILIVFLFNLPSIREVLNNTGFVEVVFEERDQDTDGGIPIEEDTVSSSEESESPSGESPSDPATDGDRSSDAPSDDQEQPDRPTDDPDATVEIDDNDGREIVIAPDEQTDNDVPPTTRSTTLFFIRVSDDGRILAEPVQRTIRFSGGPLTHTINALIAGPNAEDLNKGLLSLIPQGTELISARVSEGIAYLNFNEAFRFNTMGLEGHLAQLQQVVHTATVFSTVNAVQILINGQTVDYLGGDGVFVGEPLTPSDISD